MNVNATDFRIARGANTPVRTGERRPPACPVRRPAEPARFSNSTLLSRREKGKGQRSSPGRRGRPASRARSPKKIKVAAFTLIEIIIAVAISAIVLACLGTLFFGAMRLRDRTTLAAEEAAPVDRALGIMKRDLLAVVPVGKLAGPMGTDAAAVASTPTPLLEIFTASGTLSEDQPWGDVQKIDYYLQAPTNRTTIIGQNLIRGVTRNLLSSNVIIPEPQALLQGVKNLHFSFYDGTNWTDDVWSTTLSNLPIAMKVSIDFAAQPRGDAENPPLDQPPVKFYVPVVCWASTNSITNQISN